MKYWLFSNTPAKVFVMGIINPLDIIPYYRMFDISSKTVYDVPCHNCNVDTIHVSFRSVVQIYGYGDIFPRYENGAWNTDGYYVLEVYANNAALLTDMNGNLSCVREYDLKNLMRNGKIINCQHGENCYWGKKKYAVLKFDKSYWALSGTPHVWHDLCREEDIRRVNDMIEMRAKLTNTYTGEVKCSYSYFGRRELANKVTSVGDTFVVPMGITHVNPWLFINSNVRNVISYTPYFTFVLTSAIELDNLIIPSAAKVDFNITSSDSYIRNVVVRGENIEISDTTAYLERLQIWGTRNASLHLTRADFVPECMLCNVKIACSEEIARILSEKCILCNCTFNSPTIAKIVLANARQVTEQEMRMLWGDTYVDIPRLIV